MSFPSTVAGLLVFLLAVIPGLPAGKIYDAAVGVRWRETNSEQLLRLLAFSVIGLVAYAIAAGRFSWPDPSYVLPKTFTSEGFTVSQLGPMSVAYLGHVVGASLVGVIAALGLKGLTSFSPLSADRDAWDQFVNFSVPEHWVLVTLRTGESFAGKMHHADVSVGPEFRDVVLEEPALYDEDAGVHRTTWYQHLFISGSDIASVATVYMEDVDTEDRMTMPGDLLFEEVDDGG